MRYFFSFLMFLHAAIHLLGFAKGFKIAQIPNLHAEISFVSRIFWLISFLLFAFSAAALALGKDYWLYFVVAAIIISCFLIASTWSNTKYGMIVNFIIMVVAVLSIFSIRFQHKTDIEISQIIEPAKTIIIDKLKHNEIFDLPAPVKQWLEKSGVVGKEKIHTVWLKQEARIKMKPGQKKWSHAKAEQYFTTQNPAFVWNVKMNMLPLIQITGRDKFAEGKGEMQIKLFSAINVVNEKGNKIDEGTIQRYLGEIVWFPSAALNPNITWEAIDSYSAKATINYNGTKGSGIFHFNSDGDFVRYCALRFKDNTHEAKRFEWVIDVKEHAVVQGIKIPVKMTATWKLDIGDWTWLEMEITDIKYNINAQ
nr:DUF6544 family protein [uncultured Draconibacterium sp.]